MESKAIITLKKGEGRTVKAGGAWIFDNEIASAAGTFQNGDIVTIHDFDGYPMGKGYINQNSTIRIRMLTRNAGEVIDEAFLEKRVRDAWNYRKDVMSGGNDALFESDSMAGKNDVLFNTSHSQNGGMVSGIGNTNKPDLNCCRIIFGEADFLPGLVVDKYNDLLVLQSLSLGMENLKETIIQSLLTVLEEDGIKIRGVFERSDAPVRKKEGLPQYKGFWKEAFDPVTEIVENGIRYMVDVENGQKTGFFLDQKYNRLAMQKICAGKEKVLDCFTHMGTFALNAGYAGAKDVLGLDISDYAVSQARDNAKRNHLENTVRFLTANVLEELPRLHEQKEQFDVVILDPPAFTKSREATKNALKGYREINSKGLKLVKDRGYFATCSCSHFMTQELFTKVIGQAAGIAHKKLRQVEQRTQAPDHPVLWGAQESFYLKFYIFQVFGS